MAGVPLNPPASASPGLTGLCPRACLLFHMGAREQTRALVIALYHPSHSLPHHPSSPSGVTIIGLELMSLGCPSRITQLCWSVPVLFLRRPISPTLPSLSASPSPKSCYVSVHLFLPIFISAFLPLSLSPYSFHFISGVFPSLHLCQPGWVRVGPGGSGIAQPGRLGEQCGIQEAGRRHGNAPAPPSPRAGRACQEGAMVTSGACPPRAPPRPRTLFQGWARRGRPAVASAWSQEGLPSSSPFSPLCLGFSHL